MRIDFPKSVIEYARYAAPARVPARRTNGWTERPDETREYGVLMDTIACQVLWCKYFCIDNDLHSTVEMTGRGGDACDLYIHGPINTKKRLDINVKSSRGDCTKYDENWYENRSHIGVKSEEIQKSSPRIYVQVFVCSEESEEQPHIHVGRWMHTGGSAWTRQNECEIPNTGGHRGYWIKAEDTNPQETLIPRIRSWRAKQLENDEAA